MEIETLKRVIRTQKREREKIFQTEKMIDRENLEYAKRFLKHPNILAVLGVRRCGKSTFSLLLAQALKEKPAYINFDDERLAGIKTEDLDKVLHAFYELYGSNDFIILDEIQNVPHWELFASRLRRTKKVIITGSNSKLLSGELATHLTGRYIDFTLYPFSFKEIIDFMPDSYVTEDRAKARKKAGQYFRASGFPEYEKFGERIVLRTYEDILSKDCLQRYDIREEKTFRELAKYLISNFASEFTYSKLSKIFSIGDIHTVKNYVSYLDQAFLIAVLERFSPKLKEQVLAPRKVYAIDHGFCNFLSFKTHDKTARIYENIVCIELLRRKALKLHQEIYYWKDHQQREVDFIVKEGPRVKQLIQVSYDISDLKTRERELRSLLKASKELKCRNLLVITDDYEAEETVEERKVKFIPLWKWLLEK